MPIPKYALNHREVDNRFPRTSDKERRIKKLDDMILNDRRQIHKDNLKLETHKLEQKILQDLINTPTHSPTPSKDSTTNTINKRKRTAVNVAV